MAVDVALFLPHRPLPASLGMADRVLLWCFRSWLGAVTNGQAPRQALLYGLTSLGLEGWARTTGPFMEAAIRAWGEPLRLHPVGCGCPLSHDECQLLDCVRAVEKGDRIRFDMILRDMAARADRNRLWMAAARLRGVAPVNPRAQSSP